jgi:hypothetical protein
VPPGAATSSRMPRNPSPTPAPGQTTKLPPCG